VDDVVPAGRPIMVFDLLKGWGFGGSVDVADVDPWNQPGRYGWVVGTGTAAHIIPGTGTVTVLLSQLAITGPTSPELMRDFWRHAAAAL
jgi:CubicO group peptidase (beta-lactamase class C family)